MDPRDPGADIGVTQIVVAPASKADEHGKKKRRRARYFLGLLLLAFVVFLWVASSTLIQFIFDEQDFSSPFFLTYFSTSLFTIYLGSVGIRELLCTNRKRGYQLIQDRSYVPGSLGTSSRTPTPIALGVSDANASRSRRNSSNDAVQQLSTPPSDSDASSSVSSVSSTSMLVDPNQQDLVEGYDAGGEGMGSRNNNNNTDGNSSTAAAAPGELNSSDAAEPTQTTTTSTYGFRDTAKLALLLCPVWFAMNVLFNWALNETSVASNTILSTTSGVFVMIFSFLLFRERLDWLKGVAVLLTVGGAVMVALDPGQDLSKKEQRHAVFGDLLSVASAATYGFYTVCLRWKIPDENAIDMQLLFGCIGLFNLILFWPFFFVLHFSGAEKFVLPSSQVVGFLLLNGLFGTVVSDFLWAKVVLLTTPLVATIGLSLTIPLAMLADFIIHGKRFSPLYFCGSVVVVLGFVLVNWKSSADMASTSADTANTASSSSSSTSSSSASADEVAAEQVGNEMHGGGAQYGNNDTVDSGPTRSSFGGMSGSINSNDKNANHSDSGGLSCKRKNPRLPV